MLRWRWDSPGGYLVTRLCLPPLLFLATGLGAHNNGNFSFTKQLTDWNLPNPGKWLSPSLSPHVADMGGNMGLTVEWATQISQLLAWGPSLRCNTVASQTCCNLAVLTYTQCVHTSRKDMQRVLPPVTWVELAISCWVIPIWTHKVGMTKCERIFSSLLILRLRFWTECRDMSQNVIKTRQRFL